MLLLLLLLLLLFYLVFLYFKKITEQLLPLALSSLLGPRSTPVSLQSQLGVKQVQWNNKSISQSSHSLQYYYCNIQTRSYRKDRTDSHSKCTASRQSTRDEFYLVFHTHKIKFAVMLLTDVKIFSVESEVCIFPLRRIFKKHALKSYSHSCRITCKRCEPALEQENSAI